MSFSVPSWCNTGALQLVQDGATLTSKTWKDSLKFHWALRVPMSNSKLVWHLWPSAVEGGRMVQACQHASLMLAFDENV